MNVQLCFCFFTKIPAHPCNNSLVTPNEVEAIIGGYHGDPFRVLGPHHVKKGWVVRAFLPQASEASVVLDGRTVPMDKTDPQGLYTACIDQDPGAYRIRLKLWNGAPQEIEDPYRFPPILTDFDLYLHGEGTHFESYKKLGAHFTTCQGVPGVRFAVWAPNAIVVSVVGDFNEWDGRRHPMRLRTGGIWEIFIPSIGEGTHYKYQVRSRFRGYQQQKAAGAACLNELTMHVSKLRLSVLALGLSLMGCVQNPIPEGYKGPIARVIDTIEPNGTRSANTFYVDEINGQRIDNAAAYENRVNQGNGFTSESIR